MIKIDTSKMKSKKIESIKPPFMVIKYNNFYLCVNGNGKEIKLISMPEGYIQSGTNYYSIEDLLNAGYELYSATINVEEKLK